MRISRIDFSKKPPADNRFLGYQGENNATVLEVIPPVEFAENSNVKSYRLTFDVN